MLPPYSPHRVGNRVKGILSFTKESIPLLIPREKGFPLQANSLKSCGACRLHYLRAALPRLVLLYGNYIISVGVLSMMGYQVEAAFSAVCRTTSTIRSPRGFPPAAKCSEIFIRLFPHTKYCVPFSACMTCPVRGVKISLSLFAIQCPPYSVFKVQCRTKAAKISAYIYHLSFTVCRC